MARHEKLLAQMQRTKSGYRPADFAALFAGFGFDRLEGSRHTKYRHPRFPQLWTMIPRTTPLSKGYAEDAVRIISELGRLEEEERGPRG